MLRFLAQTPPRTRVASLNTIFFDDGHSSITFNAPSDPYLVINHLPPASKSDSGQERGVPSPPNCALNPPLHWHFDQAERFHVLDGQVKFYVEGVETIASTGDVVTIPKQAFHTFRNASGDNELVIEFVLDPVNRERDEGFFSNQTKSRVVSGQQANMVI
jgi:mannose-6-phosphate isomerase-like protein (cupin superfamily)